MSLAVQQSRCAVCFEERKIRQREFSAHAWTALTVWGEVDSTQARAAMCNTCYGELREMLIDRASEVELYARQSSNDLAAVHDLTGFRPGETSGKSLIAS